MTTMVSDIKQPAIENNERKEILTLGQVNDFDVNLNVKMYPDIKSLVVGYLLPKTSVEIIEDCGKWYKIKFNNRNGYVVKQNINIDGETQVNKKIEVFNNYGKVTDVDTNLTVRREPINNSLPIGYLLPETVVTIINEEDGWYKLLYNSAIGEKEGYVKREYIKAM